MAKKEAAAVLEPEEAQEQLDKYQAKLVPEATVDLPKGLEMPTEAEKQELFFKQETLQPGQRAIVDTTAYGAPVVHVF